MERTFEELKELGLTDDEIAYMKFGAAASGALDAVRYDGASPADAFGLLALAASVYKVPAEA